MSFPIPRLYCLKVEESKRKLASVKSDILNTMTAGFTAFSVSDDSKSTQESMQISTSQRPFIDDGYEPLSDVPKSFAEIYEISNRNRRIKDKRRIRERGASVGQDDSSVGGSIDRTLNDGDEWKPGSQATFSSAALHGCEYFDESGKPADISAEGTVRLFFSPMRGLCFVAQLLRISELGR